MSFYRDSKNALPIQPGQVVIIAEGSKIRTTHPKGDRISKRNQKIKVFDVSPGYCGHPPEIMWPGTGGYWCYVDMDAVKEVNDV